MIQLRNPRRLKRRENAELKPGVSQDLCRVLAIAQTAKGELYSAKELAILGWPDAHSEAFTVESELLNNWAKKREIVATSQHVDEVGRKIRPAKWRGTRWQREVADQIWNKACEIMEQACQLYEQRKEEPHHLWYEPEVGVFAVTPEQQPAVLAICNKKYFAIIAKKQKEPWDDSWKQELTAFLAEQKQEPQPDPGTQVNELLASELQQVRSDISVELTNHQHAIAEMLQQKQKSKMLKYSAMMATVITLIIAVTIYATLQKREPGIPGIPSPIESPAFNSADILFVAAFEKDVRFVVHKDGFVQEGDYLTFDDTFGLLKQITPQFLIMVSDQGLDYKTLPSPFVYGRRAYSHSDCFGFPGNNLAKVLETIADLKGYDIVGQLPEKGYLYGNFQAKNTEEVINKSSTFTSVYYDSGEIIIHEKELRFFAGFAGMSLYSTDIRTVYDDAQQAAYELDFSKGSFIRSESITEPIQFEQLLEHWQLKANLKDDKLILTPKEGK